MATSQSWPILSQKLFQSSRNLTLQSFINSVLVLLLILLFYSYDTGQNNLLVNFSSRWFVEIGPTIFALIVINLTISIVDPLMWSLINGLSRCRDRGCTCDSKRTKQLTQHDYLKLYEPSEFQIEAKYATMLVTIALCLFYGTGMPIIFLAAALFLIIQFWIDKYLLLRCQKRPPQYDDYLANKSLSFMKLILLFHVIGFAMLFNGPIFSQSDQI